MALLTKSDILKGIDDPKEFTIESLGGEIYLRPLSSAELNEVTDIEAEGYGNFEATSKGRRNPDTTGKMNLKKMNQATAKAKYHALYLSMNNPKNDEWSLEEIKQLHGDQIDEIYENVMKLSGAETREQDIKNFPEDE